MGNTVIQENLRLDLDLEYSRKLNDSSYAAEANANSGYGAQQPLPSHHHFEADKNHHKVEGTSRVDSSNNSNPGVDPLMMAMLYMMEYVNLQQQTASVQVKQIQANASVQIKLNNEDAKENFIPLTTKALYTQKKTSKGTWGDPFVGSPIYYYKTVYVKTTKPNAVGINQVQNQEVSQVRDGISNQLIILRQNASVDSTQVSTTMDQSQQTVSAFSAVVNLLAQVTQEINQK